MRYNVLFESWHLVLSLIGKYLGFRMWLCMLVGYLSIGITQNFNFDDFYLSNGPFCQINSHFLHQHKLTTAVAIIKNSFETMKQKSCWSENYFSSRWYCPWKIKKNWIYIGGGPLIYFSWGYKKWNLADPSHPWKW